MSPSSQRSISQRARRRLARTLPSIRTLTFLLGLGTTVWIAIGWAGMRMREGRGLIRAEREKKERLRQHFSSTLTNISFTVYALLPTLSSQAFSLLDVEASIAELTELASASSSERAKSLDSSGILSEDGAREDPSRSDQEQMGAERGDQMRTLGLVADTPRGSMFFDRGMPGTITPAAVVPPPSSTLDLHHSVNDTSSQTIMPSHSSWANEFTSSHHHPSDHFASGRDRAASMDRSVLESASDISDLGGMTSGSDLDAGTSSGHVSPRHGNDVSGQILHAPSSSFTNPSLPSGTSPRDSLSTFVTGSSPSPPGSSALHLSSGDISSEHRSPEVRGSPVPVHMQRGNKTKAQLWNEVKVKSLTRSITSIYLIPLLILQTTSQLTLLSRLHLLRGLAGESHNSSAPQEDVTRDPWTAEFNRMVPQAEHIVEKGKEKAKEGLRFMWKPWDLFSVNGMGLAEFASDRTEATRSVDGQGGLLSSISNLLGSASALLYNSTSAWPVGTAEARPMVPLESVVDAETERAFLCFSWWFLHVGWRRMESRVEAAVLEVFEGVGLKKSLTMKDWAELVDQVRQKVEAELSADGSFAPLDLLPLLFPPTDSQELRRALASEAGSEECPFHAGPAAFPLSELLQQTRLHLSSPDFLLVLPLCVDALHRSMLDELAADLYAQDTGVSMGGNEVELSVSSTRKLVQCLPSFTKWSKRVWEGIPDEAVDRVLGMREVEAFSALIYGDFREAVAVST